MSKKPKLNQTSIIEENKEERELQCLDYELCTGDNSRGSWSLSKLGLGLKDTIKFLASKGDTTIDDNLELLLEVEVTESVFKAITLDELQSNDSLVEVTIIRPKNSPPLYFSGARASFSSVVGQHSAGDVKEKTKEYYVRRFETKLREFEEKITKMYLRRKGAYQIFESKRTVGERLFKSEPDSKPRNEGEVSRSIKAKSFPINMTNQSSIKGFDKTILKHLQRDKSYEKLKKFDKNHFIPNALNIQVNYLHSQSFNYSKPIWVAIRELQKYLIDLNERNEKRRRRTFSNLKSKSKLKLRNIKKKVETRDLEKRKYSVSKGCVSKSRKTDPPFPCQKHGLLPSSNLQSLSKNQTNVLICNIDREFPVVKDPPTKTNNISKHTKVPDRSSRDLIAGECLTSIQKAIEYHLESMTSTEKLNRPELSNVGSLSPYDLGLKNTAGRSVLVNSCRSRSHGKLSGGILTPPETKKNKTRLSSKELDSTVTSSRSISCTNLQSPNVSVRNLENNNDELLKEGYTNFNYKQNHLNTINKIKKAHKENGVSSCDVSWEVSSDKHGFPTNTTSNICGNELKYFVENNISSAKNEMKLCAAINLTCKKVRDRSESIVKESKRDSMASTQDTLNIIIKNYKQPEQSEKINNTENFHFPLKSIKVKNIPQDLNNGTLADVIMNKGINPYCEGISELEECNMKRLTLLKHSKIDPSFNSKSVSLHQDHIEEEKVVLEKDSDFSLQTKNEEFLTNRNTQHYLSGECPQSNNSREREILTESIALKHLIKEINKKLPPSKDTNLSSKNQIDTTSTNYVITDDEVIPTFKSHKFTGSNNKLDFSRDSVCQTVISKQSQETSNLNTRNPIRKRTSKKYVHEEEEEDDENCSICYTQEHKGEPQQNISVNNEVINKVQNKTTPKKQFPNCGYSCEDIIQVNINASLKKPHFISTDNTSKKSIVTIYKIKKVELAPSMSDSTQDNERQNDRKKYIHVESDKCVTEQVNTKRIEMKPNEIVESFTNQYQDKAQVEKEKRKIKQRIHPESGTKSYFEEGCFAEVDNSWEEGQKQGFQNEYFNEGEYNKVINHSRNENNKIYSRRNINGKTSSNINENNSKLKMFEIGSKNERRPSPNEESDYDPSQHCFQSPSSISLYENSDTFQEKLTKSNEKFHKSSNLEQYGCNEIQNCSSNKLDNNSRKKPTENHVDGKVYKPHLSHQVLDDQSSMNKIVEKETWRNIKKLKNDVINPNESCAKSEPCYISSHFQNPTCYQVNDRAYTRSANNQNNLQDFEWDVSRKSVLHKTFLRNAQIKPRINDGTNLGLENRSQSDSPSEERHALVDDSQKSSQSSTAFSPEKSQSVLKTPQSLNESKQGSSKKDNVFFWDGNKCATKNDAIKRFGQIYFDKLKQDHPQRTGACVSIPSPTVITTIPYDGVEEKISASLSNATKGFMDNEKLLRIINLKKYLQRPVLPDHTPIPSTISEKCSPINIPYSALNKFNNLKEEKTTYKHGRRLCHQEIVAISAPVALPQVEESLSSVPIRSTNSVEITYLSPWAHCWGTASEFEIPDKATNTNSPITETKQSPIDVKAEHNYDSKKLDEQNYSNESCDDVVCDERLSTEESSLDANDRYQTYINNTDNISQEYRLGDNLDKSKKISLNMTKKGSDRFGKKKRSHNQSELELTIEDFLTIIQGDNVRLNSNSSTNIAMSNSTRKWMLNEDILIKIKEILEIKAKDTPRSKNLDNK